jgi:DNA-binding GntR family transcriptional regulator
MTEATENASPLRLSRRPSLARAAADRLREAILAGTLTRGQHLVEIDTARELGISRGPLREAFKMLATEGLLEMREDRGVFVPEYAPEEIEQMVIARAMMEGMAARLFVLRAGAQDRARIESLIGRMAEASIEGSSRQWRELDWMFHETVMTGSQNRFIMRAWTNLGTLLRVYMMQLNPLYDLERPRVLETHRAMAASVLGNDPEAAERLFRRTILRSGFFVIGKPVPAELVDDEPDQRPEAKP